MNNPSRVQIINMQENLVMIAETIVFYRKTGKDYTNALELYADIYQDLANAGQDSYLMNVSSKYKINF